MPAPAEDDAELMRRVQHGDRDAFEAIVNRHRQAVINFAYRMLQDLTEAEDIAQAAFVQVFKAADRYQTSARFTTWLFTITRNLCLNELRRRSRHPAESLEQTRDDDSDLPQRQFEERRTVAPPEAMLRDELTAKVEESVAQLPESQRTALLLYQREELSYEEICTVLGCSLSATKSLIHRARESLKRQLKPYLRTGAWPGSE